MLKIYINGVLDKSVYNADILNENLSFTPITIGQKGLTGSHNKTDSFKLSDQNKQQSKHTFQIPD